MTFILMQLSGSSSVLPSASLGFVIMALRSAVPPSQSRAHEPTQCVSLHVTVKGVFFCSPNIQHGMKTGSMLKHWQLGQSQAEWPRIKWSRKCALRGRVPTPAAFLSFCFLQSSAWTAICVLLPFLLPAPLIHPSPLTSYIRSAGRLEKARQEECRCEC